MVMDKNSFILSCFLYISSLFEFHMSFIKHYIYVYGVQNGAKMIKAIDVRQLFISLLECMYEYIIVERHSYSYVLFDS